MESRILLFLSVVSICYGHEEYLKYIPNGNHVPNPCTVANLTDTWSRVGHIQLEQIPVNHKTNSFGNDFKSAYNVSKTLAWQKLCKLDSDGDGRRNGEELGDKECAWTYNSDKPVELASTGITHPGIPEETDGSLSEETMSKFCV